MGNSVNVVMPLLLLLLLVLPLSNPVSSEQSGLKENVNDDPEETMYKNEKLNGIEGKFSELMQRVKELEVQFESSLEEMMLDTQKSELAIQIADLQNQLKEVKVERKNQNLEAAHNLKSQFEMQFKAEVKKELDKVLPTAVEQGLRNLPFEMVCAYRELWETKGVVNYDNITVEFNNSDRPGGADGTMNIETGVFTTSPVATTSSLSAALSRFRLENGLTCTSTTMRSDWRRATLGPRCMWEVVKIGFVTRVPEQ